MITKFRIEESNAASEFGMACQRIVPWRGQDEESPFGAMACFLPPGADSEPDCHDQEEVMIVLSGTGAVHIAAEVGSVTTGDVVLIPRNLEHVVHNSGAKTLSWVSLYWPLHESTTQEAP
jgi:mannose-6-phosphate isomerase-like protein (cupin superfamily)